MQLARALMKFVDAPRVPGPPEKAQHKVGNRSETLDYHQICAAEGWAGGRERPSLTISGLTAEGGIVVFDRIFQVFLFLDTEDLNPALFGIDVTLHHHP